MLAAAGIGLFTLVLYFVLYDGCRSSDMEVCCGSLHSIYKTACPTKKAPHHNH